MKKYIGLALLLVTVYLVSLVATTPLAVAINYLPIPKQVKLNQPSGSLWQGEILSVELPQLTLNRVSWDFKPASLLLGRLSAQLTLNDSKQLQGQGVVGMSFSGWFVKDWQLEAPASWLIEQVPLPLPLSLEGDIQLDLAEASQGSPWCEQLAGQLRWLGPLVVTPLGELPLDNANAELSCIDGQPSIVLNHKDAQLELELLASVGQPNWLAEGKIKAGAQMPRSISNNLKFIGRPDPQGFYRFKQQGRLPR
ncbi:type II secretion system protein N [Agarivorans sp. TSD2052]|uniref:type II secretion system protein N n=1 Tax=Agarivorans sp. TSD2052 TaxID=2937286 RepID=UPI00200C54E5|nr:type II secretion system protein N [Agarivorans sp. TSD2052]UPW18244.1 type II secretion system protein N [Agarivorans sp. TSD2052]